LLDYPQLVIQMNFKDVIRALYRINIEEALRKVGLETELRNVYQSITGSKNKENIEQNFSSRGTKPLVRYIHLGYPKAASTALQRGYFGSHNQLLHLGCGNRNKNSYWDDHGYISSDINTVMEIDLRYRVQFAYDKKRVKSVFNKYFLKAEENEYIHAVGVSNENICFNWHGGIDTVEKANRLFDIFQNGTKVIIVLREQKSLIESLYKETVRFGYAGTFEDYLKYIWQYKDRNFFYDFHFTNLISLYEQLFGEQNVITLLFENFTNNQAVFLSFLSNHLGINTQINEVNAKYNRQLSHKELHIKRLLNKLTAHTFEKGFLHPFDTHRHISYYLDELQEEQIDLEHYIDYDIRNMYCELSKNIVKKTQVKEIDLSWDNKYGKKIIETYRQSNSNLSRVICTNDLNKYNYI